MVTLSRLSPTAQQRVVAGRTMVTRASVLLAWFPASWASKTCFQQDTAGSYQNVQSAVGAEDAGERMDGQLLAVRFADNRAPSTKWDIDPEFAQRNCFSATVEGYSRNLIQPALSWKSSFPLSLASLQMLGSAMPRCALSTGPQTTVCSNHGT